MRDRIKSIIKDIFRPQHYEFEVHWGYDCIGVELTKCFYNEVNYSDIQELKYELNAEVAWIKINEKSNFVLCFDISNMIFSFFDCWDSYEKEYGF